MYIVQRQIKKKEGERMSYSKNCFKQLLFGKRSGVSHHKMSIVLPLLLELRLIT